MQQEMLKHEAEIIEMDRQQKLLREHESKERMRQSIRENSWELRELESKLKNAYAVKECLSQIKENEARKQQERVVAVFAAAAVFVSNRILTHT